MAPRTLTQGCKSRGGREAKAEYWHLTASWLRQANLPQWNGLTLLGIDSGIWRTEDTPANGRVFSRHKGSLCPQVRMFCQMKLATHLLTRCAFDSYPINALKQAEQLIQSTPDNSVNLFHKGLCSLGLSYPWQHAGNNRHWLIPVRNSLQYQQIRSLERHDKLVSLSSNSCHIKRSPGLPETLTAGIGY